MPLVVVVQRRLVAAPLRRDLVPREHVELEDAADQGQRDVVELESKASESDWLKSLKHFLTGLEHRSSIYPIY